MIVGYNQDFYKMLGYLMPSWDSNNIDIELRVAGILGLQGTGKTTLAMTIASKLYERFGDDFISVQGFWLHKIIPDVKDKGLLKGKKYVLIILEDATSILHFSQSRRLLTKDMKYFWRLRHEMKEAGLKTYTAKIAVLINMHSYMTITKYLRNAQMIIIKSKAPKWQRYEHEDITLKWIDNILVRELTRMRYSNNVNEIHAALNKAIVVYHDGTHGIIKYEAIKSYPPNHYTNDDMGIEEDKNEDKTTTNNTQQVVLGLLRKILNNAKITRWSNNRYRVRLPATTFTVKRDVLDNIIKNN